MGLINIERVFYTDILHVEVLLPKQLHLTLVDLPSLFIVGNKD